MELSQASEQILVSAHTNTKNNVFILSQTETLFLLVNFSRYFNKQAGLANSPQLWILTLDHIPICGLLGAHLYSTPNIFTEECSWTDQHNTRLAHQKEGENKPIHSIVRKECIQILELFMPRTLWFWHLPLCQVPCWECEGPSLPLAAFGEQAEVRSSVKSQDPLLCRCSECSECKQTLTLKQTLTKPTPPTIILKNNF